MLPGLTGSGSNTSRACGMMKQRIACNFSRAARSYDQAATLQKRVAAKAMVLLFDRVSERAPEVLPVSSVLDLGTGTGGQCLPLSRQYPDAIIAGMDMAMGMLEYARQQNAHKSGISWCSGDIESLPFKNECFDLVFSSLAIQWCALDRVLSEVSQVLKPGGFFVFSTLAHSSLYELDYAWRAIGEPCRVNRFDDFQQQKHIIEQSDLQIQSLSLEPETLYYPDVFSQLRELKALGVNTVLSGQSGLMTRRKLHELRLAYEPFRTGHGLPLTYQVIYGVLQKPSLTRNLVYG